jgi:hypothetical protein
MTFAQCHSVLVSIRRKQGTRCPLVRVDCAGSVFQGRLSRSDSDPDAQTHHDMNSPFGVIVLENPGLARAPETILQIAEIQADGVQSIEE